MKSILVSFFCLFFCTCGLQAQSIQDGLKLIDLEKFGQARKMFQDLVAKNPNSENNFYAGYAYLKIAKADSAQFYFEKGLAADAKSALNKVGLGSVKLFNKDKAAAKSLFDEAVSLSKSKNAEILYRIGEAYVSHENKDPNSAIQILEKALIIDPKNAEYLLKLGDAYLEKNDGGNANLNYDRARAINPKLAKIYIQSGKVLERARNFKEAFKLYQQGIQADPSYSPAYRELGELYFRARQYDKAVENYKKYINSSDNSPETLFNYAGFLFLSKDYNESLNQLKKLENKISSPIYYRLLAYNQCELKQYEEGIKNMELFLSKAGADRILSSDYEYQGKLLVNSGKDTLAGVEKLRKAIEMDSSKTSLYREISSIYFKNKKYSQAAAEIETMIKKGIKANAQDYFELGRACYFDKSYPKADSAFAKLCEISKNSNSAYLWRARTGAKLDPDLKEGLAKSHYETYISLTKDPEKSKKDLVEAYSYLGYFFMVKKEKAKADENWNKVLELDPTNARAKEALGKK